ncbi:MAG: alpha/beta hydrolase [archaeon]
MKIYYVRGWAGDSVSPAWLPWLKEECRKRAIEFVAFEMPNPTEPKINEWVEFLRSNVVGLNEETFFLGHSIGCQAILRYLEKLPENEKIGGCIFVAGWFNLLESAYEDEEDRKIGKPWIETPIDFEKVKAHTNNFLAIFSDNDGYVPLDNSDLFRERLNAKIVIKHGEGHFDDTERIDEILEDNLELSDEVVAEIERSRQRPRSDFVSQEDVEAEFLHSIKHRKNAYKK